MAILNDLKSNISRDSVRYAHITGENYRAFLKHFGATEKDLQLMESGSLHKDIQVDIEPTMFFRQVSQLTFVFYKIIDGGCGVVRLFRRGGGLDTMPMSDMWPGLITLFSIYFIYSLFLHT